MEPGANLAVWLEQGRYDQILDVCGHPAADEASRVWVIRCRMEQGYVRAATALSHDQLAAHGASSSNPSFQLWRGFLALYDNDGRLVDEIIAEFDELSRRLGNAPETTEAISALAFDLRARTGALRFTLSGRGPADRGPIVADLAAAADQYRAAGQVRDTLAAVRRAALFAIDGLDRERARGRELLVQARDEAELAGMMVAQANAELALAELNLRAFLDGDTEREPASVLGAFDAVAERFRSGGHAFGDALAQWGAAQWLLAYGITDGAGLAYMAIEGFAAADVPSSEQRVWSALNAWHTAHGDLAQARDARDNEARLAAGMGFALAAEVRILDEANQAFRSGDVAKARTMLAERSIHAAGMQAASRVMLSTAANAVGLRAEAQQVIEGVIDDLTAAGSSVILGEALTVLAAMVMGTDEDRATELLTRAAAVAHEAQSPAEEARYRAQLAWTTVVRRRSRRQTPFLNDDARIEFDRAATLLAPLRTLDARTELARMCQLRAQASFLSEDWDGCGTWLTQAEEVARAFSLRPDLAFILCYQGLVMIQVGRNTGPSTYDQAAVRLNESRELFETVDLPAFLWQTTFYRAICDIEAARWPEDAGGNQAERRERARGLMEEASRLIDWLRESSERGTADRQQQVWMAFSVDKQIFYAQGFRFAWDACSDPVAAWPWLERMKGRALLDALTDERAAPDTPATGARRSADAVTPIRQAARQSEPPGYAEIRALLAAEEGACSGRRVLVAAYLCTPERTLLFGGRSDWPTPRAEPVALDYRGMHQFASGTFRVPGGIRMMMEDLADGGLASWHQFASLLAPLMSWSDPDDIIYLIPHGILHDLPLHTLPIEGSPLIERNPVCYAPAAAVLRHTLLGADTPVRDGRMEPAVAVFGDARGDLPYARSEAATIAAMFGIDPAIGPAVTKERVVQALGTARMFHVAGHGHMSTADGFASYLDLAGDETLRAADLLGRRLRPSLAVLSGCETGISEQRPGDEIVGFIRALLLSGVRSVLASQWQVADDSTEQLLSAFHQAAHSPGVSFADALRSAVLAIRRDPRYAHPYHWGGFTLVGSWR